MTRTIYVHVWKCWFWRYLSRGLFDI